MNRRHTKRKKGGFHLKNLSVVIWLIAINIAIYLVLFVASLIVLSSADTDLSESSRLTLLLETNFAQYFTLVPVNILQGKFLPALVVHMFTHVLFIHLFINMFVLFSLGGLCERIIGRKRFLWFYVLSGIFAGILSVALAVAFGSPDLFSVRAGLFGSPVIPMVGASGAIFAIAGLYMVLLPRLRFMIIFLPFFSFPAYILIPAVLFGIWAVSVLLPLLTPYQTLPVGNVAHFGGFIAGAGYGIYLRSRYKRKIKMLQRMFK